jgi:SAM-dependent methyltransferase
LSAIELLETSCAICGTALNATELYAANFDSGALNPALFAPRRIPDDFHFRMVRCATCGLVRSDPIADPNILREIYRNSVGNYDLEIDMLKKNYGCLLEDLAQYGVRKGSFLEIGCGTGFLLEEALARGYTDVHGVEPSLAAVARAAPLIRPNIVCDILRPGLFEREQFDVVCMFQVFDHIPDPGDLLDECWRLLKPGGLILSLNHNVQAISARLLKERSPIVIIQHTYLYSPETMERIFTAHEFEVCHVRSIRDKFRLRYLARLAPLPRVLRPILLSALNRLPIGCVALSLPLGNIELVARKPNGD